MLYQSKLLSDLFTGIYLLMLGIYLVKEIYQFRRAKNLNLPRNVLILGTVLSWYFGIVYFNGDLAFTTLNVISHGIPYMALIWFFEKEKYKRGEAGGSRLLKVSFGRYGLVFFILLLCGFAYVEEGLWDGLVWKEHSALFSPFSYLPHIEEKKLLSLLVPLLALPQATHYVLDGFIWRKESHKREV